MSDLSPSPSSIIHTEEQLVTLESSPENTLDPTELVSVSPVDTHSVEEQLQSDQPDISPSPARQVDDVDALVSPASVSSLATTPVAAATVPAVTSMQASPSSYSTSLMPTSVLPSSPFTHLYSPTAALTTPAEFARITHSFQNVHSQIQNGLAQMKSIAVFLKQICQTKEKYAQELLKSVHSLQLHAAPSSSASSPLPLDGMISTSACVHELKDSFFEEARQESEWAKKVLLEIVTPLLSFVHEAEQRRKIIHNYQHALAQQIKLLQEQLLQSKIHTLKIIANLHTLEEKEQQTRNNEDNAQTGSNSNNSNANNSTVDTGSEKKEKEKGKGALASFSNFFSKLNKRSSSSSNSNSSLVSTAGTNTSSSTGASSSSSSTSSNSKDAAAFALDGFSEEIREKAYLSSLQYALSVQSANARQKQYFENDLPSLFSDLQKLEYARLSCLKLYLGQLAACNLSLLGPHKQRIQSFVQTVSSLDAQKDIHDYVENIVKNVGETFIPNEFKYELNFTPMDIRHNEKLTKLVVFPEEIQSNITDADTEQPAVELSETHTHSISEQAAPSHFGQTLEGCMTLQENSHPDLTEPIVLHSMIEAIKTKPSTGKEKYSALLQAQPPQQLLKLKKQLDNGNYDISSWSVSDCIGILKLWLRSLNEPLLPLALYAAAIQSVKKEQTLLSSQAQNVATRFNNAPEILAPRESELLPGHELLPPSSALQLTPQLQQYTLHIFQSLPTLNQRVLHQLAVLVNSVAIQQATVVITVPVNTKEQQEKTDPRLVAATRRERLNSNADSVETITRVDWNKWSTILQQLATIFTSCVLKTHSSDATELLTCSRHEQRFTCALWISLSHQHMQQTLGRNSSAVKSSTASASYVASELGNSASNINENISSSSSTTTESAVSEDTPSQTHTSE